MFQHHNLVFIFWSSFESFVVDHKVTAEGCKNLLLAGVSATLRDEGVVTAMDIGANFLLEADDVGKNVRDNYEYDTVIFSTFFFSFYVVSFDCTILLSG